MSKENISKIVLVVVAMIWGSGFPATKIVLDSGVHPYEFLAVRFLITGFIMALILGIKKVRLKKDELGIGAAAGIMLFAAFAYQTVGLMHTTASKNAFITGANVIFTPFFAWAFTKIKPKFLTSFICFVGIGILSVEKNFTINYGDFLTLICAVCFALQIAIIGSRIRDKDAFAVNSFQMITAGLVALAFNFIFEDGSIAVRTYSLKQILALSYLVIFNTFICYLGQTMAQKYVETSKVSLILATEMVFGAVFSIAILGEALTPKVILGGAVIFISILMSEMKKYKL